MIQLARSAQFRFLKAITLSILFATTCVSVADAADARRFPGKGDNLTWQRACTSAVFADQLRNEGKIDEAIDAYKTAIEVYAEDPTFYSGLAKLFEHSGRLNEAEMAYRNAISKDSQYVDGWIGLSNILTKTNRPVDALTALRQAYKIAPTNVDVCLALGNMLIKQKRQQEGVDILQKAQTYARHGGERDDIKKQIEKLASTDAAPPPTSSVRLFKIRMAKGAAAAGPSIVGVDGLYAYSGPPGKTIVQKGAAEIMELVLIDKGGKRMFLAPKDALAIIRSTGMNGLKAKGWAGEVRPITITDMDSDGNSGSQFVIPPPI